MTTYRIEFEISAARALKKLDRGVQTRILTAITDLADNPRPNGAVKLTGLDALRIRVGDYRVVYVIDDTIVTVTIVKVAHRSTVYGR